MESHLENPMEISAIARRLKVSHRQLDRLFQRHLNTSPARHYRDMRLLRAQGLIRQSELTIGEIALGCGFQSSSHLSKFYKQKFAVTPLQSRKSH